MDDFTLEERVAFRVLATLGECTVRQIHLDVDNSFLEGVRYLLNKGYITGELKLKSKKGTFNGQLTETGAKLYYDLLEYFVDHTDHNLLTEDDYPLDYDDIFIPEKE